MSMDYLPYAVQLEIEESTLRRTPIAEYDDNCIYGADLAPKTDSPECVVLAMRQVYYSYLQFREKELKTVEGKVSRNVFLLTFLFKYFSKYAISRYLKEEKLPSISKYIALNGNCPELLLIDSFINILHTPINSSILNQFLELSTGFDQKTAYFKVQDFRNFVNRFYNLSSLTKDDLDKWRICLSTLRLHYLLKEIRPYSYRNLQAVEQFNFLIKQHKFEQEKEYVFPSRTEYGVSPLWRVRHLRSILYYYPKFINDFYQKSLNTRVLMAYKPNIDSLLSDILKFYVLYFKHNY